MKQDNLFDASIYVLRAYDQLVLAYDNSELEQLRSLKAQVMRAYVALQDLKYESSFLPGPGLSMDEADMPF